MVPNHSAWYDGLLQPIMMCMPGIGEDRIREQVKGFAEALAEGLETTGPLQDPGSFYVETAPAEAYLEWIFDDMRFGFSFSGDINGTYWFAITIGEDGGTTRRKGDFGGGYAAAVDSVLETIGRG